MEARRGVVRNEAGAPTYKRTPLAPALHRPPSPSEPPLKGIVFNLLETLVRRDLGDGAWDALLLEAGVDGAYTSLGSYEDDELFRLVGVAASHTGRAPTELVRWFGREAAPLFYARFPEFFDGHDSALSFIRSINSVIHPEVRKLYPGAFVPNFVFDERADGTLAMRYDSPRRMCAFAEGLIEGAAIHFGEAVALHQETCMLRGDEACTLILQFGHAAGGEA